MHQSFNFAVAFSRWIGRPRHFWVALLVLLASALLCVRAAEQLENGLRYAGMALQLLGVGTVVAGIDARRRQFELPSIARLARDWWNARPRLRGRPFELVQEAPIGMHAELSIFTDLPIWTADNSSRPPEERIAAIVNNLTTVQKRLEALEKHRRSDVAQAAGAIAVATEGLTEQTNKLSVALRKLGAGGIQFEFVGVFWIVTGVVLATIPIELEPYVQWAK